MMAKGIIDEQAARALYQYCCETHHSEYISVHVNTVSPEKLKCKVTVGRLNDKSSISPLASPVSLNLFGQVNEHNKE